MVAAKYDMSCADVRRIGLALDTGGQVRTAMGASALLQIEDDFGAAFETSKNLVVVGSRRTPLALPSVLAFKRQSVAVGETARLFVFTGLRAQEMALEIFRDGRRVERREIGAGRSGVIEFQITASDRGGFGVSLTLVRDHQLIRQTARVFVPWDDRRLDLAFSSFRDRMRPGTRESFSVTARAHDGSVLDSDAAERFGARVRHRDGTRSVYIEDSEGNTVEIMHS